jgi:hypothetical protein
VIKMDPQYQPAYSFLANLEFKGASTADDSRPAFETIDKGEDEGEGGREGGREGRRARHPGHSFH